MPQIRFSTSAMGQYLVPQIKNFIVQNMNATINDGSVSIGAEIKANAISYGIALALSSPIFKAALAVGVVPTPVPPSTVTAGNPVLGTSIVNVLSPQVTEQ